MNLFFVPTSTGSASWSKEAYSALSTIVISCKNFKVRIKSAAALSVPAARECYGNVQQFAEVWRALAQALEHSEETEDFLEYRYCASLRSELCHALLHLLSLCQDGDISAISASLSSRSRPVLQGFLVHYLTDISRTSAHDDDGVMDARRQTEPTDRLKVLDRTLNRLKQFELENEADLATVIEFLEVVRKSCEVVKASDSLDNQHISPQFL